MISLHRFLVLLLSIFVIFCHVNHGAASPIPDDNAPNHAGPPQFGSQHLGPTRSQHLGPPRSGQTGIGSTGPIEATYY